MKICIIGCGSWAAYYSRVLSKLSRGVHLYFCSRDIQRAMLYAQRFKGKGYFDKISDALKEEGICAFLVFTPHHVHLQNIQELAASNCYILLQKPMAGTLEDAKEIAGLCEEKKIKLMLAENFRFMPAIQAAKKILESDVLGKPLFAYIEEVNAYFPTGWRTRLKEMGGGILVDLGIHYLSALRYLFGEPAEVSALLPASQFAGMEGESSVSLAAKMENGVSCSVHLAWGQSFYKATIKIICKKGLIEIKIGSHLLNLCIGNKRRAVFLGLDDMHGHRALLKDFIERTQKNLPLVLNHQEGLQDLAFVKSAYQSVRDKKIISLKEFYAQNELSRKEAR